MNLSYNERIAIVACMCWLVIALFITDPFSRERLGRSVEGVRVAYSVNNWDGFAVTGLLPVVTILGIMWIWRGKEDSDQDKDNTNPS